MSQSPHVYNVHDEEGDQGLSPLQQPSSSGSEQFPDVATATSTVPAETQQDRQPTIVHHQFLNGSQSVNSSMGEPSGQTPHANPSPGTEALIGSDSPQSLPTHAEQHHVHTQPHEFSFYDLIVDPSDLHAFLPEESAPYIVNAANPYIASSPIDNYSVLRSLNPIGPRHAAIGRAPQLLARSPEVSNHQLDYGWLINLVTGRNALRARLLAWRAAYQPPPMGGQGYLHQALVRRFDEVVGFIEAQADHQAMMRINLGQGPTFDGRDGMQDASRTYLWYDRLQSSCCKFSRTWKRLIVHQAGESPLGRPFGCGHTRAWCG